MGILAAYRLDHHDQRYNRMGSYWLDMDRYNDHSLTQKRGLIMLLEHLGAHTLVRTMDRDLRGDVNRYGSNYGPRPYQRRPMLKWP